jgi:hypothetical protein
MVILFPDSMQLQLAEYLQRLTARKFVEDMVSMDFYRFQRQSQLGRHLSGRFAVEG